MSLARRFLVCAAAALVLCDPLGALTLKIGSLVPAGSAWDRMLRSISEQWSRLSNDSVSLRVYGAGVAGDEPDMLRKINIGQLDAAMVTMSSLQTIYNGIKALSFPLFIERNDELAFVLDKMKPFFEKELEARGFKVILWSPGGWLYYFSRRPIVVPDDLRRQKLWVWGNPDEVQAWQRSGFQVVPLAATDILTSLQSGMIDAVISSPMLTASNQWFGITSNMSDLKLAPLWGAVIVGAKGWAQVPRDLQPILLKVAQRIADQLSPEIEKSDDQAISEMKKYGLQIIHVDTASREIWKKTVQDGFGMLLGTAYDARAYETAKEYLGQYRTAKKK